eukprot:g202.t1
MIRIAAAFVAILCGGMIRGTSATISAGTFDVQWSGTGVSDRECVAICEDSGTFVFFAGNGDSYPADRVTATVSTNTLTFSYPEPDSGGITTNSESWTYSSGTDSYSGSNTWSWTDGSTTENGVANVQSSRIYACTTYAQNQPTYTATWTVASSTYSPDIGVQSTSSFTITESGATSQINWSGVSGSYATSTITWDECQKTMSFTTYEDEDGGQTVTTEVWRYDSGSLTAVSSTWTWTRGAESQSGTNTVSIVSGGGANSSDGDDGISAGAVVGIVICGLCVFAMLLTLCLYCQARSKMSRGTPRAPVYASEKNVSYNNTAVPVAATVEDSNIPVATVYP